jgi:lysozyme family protein
LSIQTFTIGTGRKRHVLELPLYGGKHLFLCGKIVAETKLRQDEINRVCGICLRAYLVDTDTTSD